MDMRQDGRGDARGRRAGAGRLRQGYAAIGLMAALMGTARAAAPDPAPSPDPTQTENEVDGLQTVIVTAQKRAQNLNQVPIAISVLSGDQLQEQHTLNYDDLARAVPGLAFSSMGGEGLSRLSIRGVSSDAGSPTVTMYLDDVPITMPNLINTGASQPRFFDLERIEVLKGPQGTLFGSSALGGSIRFITRQPDLETIGGSYSSDVSGTRHGDINFEETGAINLPIIPGKVALRLAADYVQNSGYIDQLNSDGAVTNRGINSERTGAGRATLKVQVTEDLSVTPSVTYQRTTINDGSVYDLSLGSLQTAKRVQEQGQDTMVVPTLTVQDDLHWGDLTAISGYFWRHFPRKQDGTYYNSALMVSILQADPTLTAAYPSVDPSPIANIPSPAYISPTNRQFTQELRLSSKSTKESGSPFTWLVGLYFSDDKLSLSDKEYMPGLGDAIQTLYGADSTTILGDALPRDLVYLQKVHNEERQYAAFAELTYTLWDRLTLAAGLRYSYAEQSYDGVAGAYYNGDAPPSFTGGTKTGSTTPKFSATYDLGDNSSLYASATKGFRLGSLNSPVPQFGCQGDFASLGITQAPQSYAPDSLWSYEAGTKASLLNNRVSVNVSGYYIDWSHVQQTIYLLTCGFQFTANAGDAQSYGTEVEVKARVTQDLTLSLNGQVGHATLTSATPGTGASPGQWLLGVPEWTMNLGADYHPRLADGVDSFIRADWALTGPSHGAYDMTNPDYDRPIYGVVNASLGVLLDTVEVQLYAENLLDMQKTIQRPSLLSVAEGYTVRPRTVGLRVSGEF